MITLQVFSFQINLFSLIAFLVGMLSGMAILFLIYLFNALVKLNKDAVKLNNRIQNISKEEIQKVISNYQEAFTDEKKRLSYACHTNIYRAANKSFKNKATQRCSPRMLMI